MIRLQSVSKVYDPSGRDLDRLPADPTITPVLNGVDLEIADGETLVIRGESGSGKTTLLNLIAGLDRPTSGEVWINDRRIDSLDDDELARFRLHQVGIVFQAFHLEQQLTAEENVALPLLLGDVPLQEARDLARASLRAVRMESFAGQRVALLSGGQRQRVVVARAIVRRPRLLLADEPTANLDETTARAVLESLAEYQQKVGATLVLVAHDPLALAHEGWRQAICREGKVIREN